MWSSVIMVRTMFIASMSSTSESVAWAVAPQVPSEPVPVPQTANPLLSDKLLDAKVRLHRRLIEEINLSAIEKVSEGEVRRQISALVARLLGVDRNRLNYLCRKYSL